ncbi:radical SAM protein [Streptosporangium sp. NPDC005286]|uniref:B12-binding domain-containing radical SAM protein n=1 Tax=Streptosporangium sp. NPDC005286 TaxID=3154463 RepID=UPI0033AE2ABE
MTLKAVLVYSNDDGFSLGVELIRAAVADRLPPSRVEHRVWFHEDVGNLAEDYLGHYNAFMARLFDYRPDVISFSAFVWNHDEFTRMGRIVKRHLPDCRVVWGGAQANSRRMAAHLLREYPWLDLVLRGEAEDAYPDLLEQLARGGDLDTVAGLTRRVDGEPVHNDDPPDVDLGALPLVFTADRLPLEPILRRRPGAVLAYETGRGCRQKCRFCLYSAPKLRAFPMERVERELTYLLAGGIPYLRMCDAHLGISRHRAMEIFEIVAEHNRGTVVDVYPDVKHVDLDYVRAMNRAGCRVITLGIQSSDADTLQLAARRFDRQRFAQAASLIRRHHNHALAADIIIGMPGDNADKVRDSVRFAYASGVEKVHFAPLMAFPGTDFFEYAEQYGIEFFDFQPPLVVSSRGFGTEDYRRAMVFAGRVEALQDIAPTLLRCMIAVADCDVADWAERLDLGSGTDPAPLIEEADLPPGVRRLLLDGLAWDTAVRAQRATTAQDPPGLADGALVAGVAPDAVHWADHPVHLLLRDFTLTFDALAHERQGYLFPRGGAVGYPLTGPLLAAFEAAAVGITVGEWRDKTRAGSATEPTREVCDAAFRILCATGVVALREEG